MFGGALEYLVLSLSYSFSSVFLAKFIGGIVTGAMRLRVAAAASVVWNCV